MTEKEFNILYTIFKSNKCNENELFNKTGYDLKEIEDILRLLKDQEWIDTRITDKGLKALNKYKVDNAIIMAAGFGLRSLPLSRIVPKGLYTVHGEVLIERQIKQLREAGIDQIIVVVGYLKEKFSYLAEKYNVILIENDDYYRYNNISSIYAAKEYLKNTYICCSDNYFNINVFKDYIYDSYYSCKYTEEYAEEYCVTKTDGEYITEIHKGGSQAWYTIGEAYFSNSFSNTFLKYLEEEYEDPDTKKMLWDDFHIKHIKDLPIVLVKYSDEIVQEFDTVDDVIAFDPNFAEYRDKILHAEREKKTTLPDVLNKYENVKRYNSATTDSHEGRLHLNENTFGASPKCLEVLKTITLQDLYEYDMASKDFLIEEISKTFSIPDDDIYLHNGSAEIIKSLFSIALERGDNVLVSDPGWSYYASLAREKFCDIYKYQVLKDDYSYYVDVKDLLQKARENHPKLIVITSPHNPTGCVLDEKTIERVVKENPESLILLDQAYWGFAEEAIDVRRLVESYSNIIVSRTFSKYYGLADIRIGYGFCNAKVQSIYGLDLPLFRGSSISRRIAVAALKDKIYYKTMSEELCATRTWFMDELNKIPGVRVFDSKANFVAVRINGMDMNYLKEELKQQGILIRLFEDDGETIARIAIAKQDIMKKVITFIKELVKYNG